MSGNKIDDGGQAFPLDCEDWRERNYGMTRRQWLAGLAMQGMLSSNAKHKDGSVFFLLEDEVAKRAYNYADAMIAHEKGESK